MPDPDLSELDAALGQGAPAATADSAPDMSELDQALAASSEPTKPTQPPPRSGRPKTRFQSSTAPATQAAPELSWQEAGQQAIKNLVPSGVEAAQAFGSAVMHPIKTAETIGQVGEGLASQAAGAVGAPQDPTKKAQAEQLVKALEQHYATAYGSAKGLKQTIATDPVGVLMDVATVADPALGAVGKVADAGKLGALAKTAQVAQKAASYADPVANAVRVAKMVPAVVKSSPVRGLSSLATGVPKSAMDVAAKVGKQTDPVLQAKFSQYLTGGGDPTEFLQTVRNAVNDVKARNSAAYMADKSALASTPVAFDNTRSAIADAEARLQTGAPSGWEDQKAAVDTAKQWVREVSSNPDPGLRNIVHADALKQQLWNLIDKNNTSRSFLTPIWSAVKSDMAAVDPRYVDLMERYQRGLDQVNTLEKTFGVKGSSPSGMAALMKGMKAIKTSAGTNLMDQVAAHEPSIPYMIAGQALNPWHAQHLQGAVESAGMMAAIPWALMAHNPAAIPAFAGQAALQSPRLAAHVFSGASKLAEAPVGPAAAAGRAAYYAGRADQEEDRDGAAPSPDPVFSRMLQQESGNSQFDHKGNVRVSKKGAVGAAQVMPATGPFAASLAGEPWDPTRLATDEDYNRRLGKAYFDNLHQQFGDPVLAAAAYDAGPGAVHKALGEQEEKGGSWLDYLPAETRQYVKNVALAANDEGRVMRKSGGKVESEEAAIERLVMKLINLVERSKSAEKKRTEPLLKTPDSLVAKALNVAQRAI